MADTVTIPRALFESLVCDAEDLNGLFAAGVDNWRGMDYVEPSDGSLLTLYYESPEVIKSW